VRLSWPNIAAAKVYTLNRSWLGKMPVCKLMAE
jgi:hypothetical protein